MNFNNAFCFAIGFFLLAGCGQESTQTSSEKIRDDLVNLAILKETMGKNSEAIELYSKALEITKAPQYYSHRGLLYEKEKNHSAAVSDLTSAIALDGTNMGYYKDRCRNFFELDKLTETIEDCSKVIESKQGDYDQYKIRGVALMSKKEFKMALLDIDAAIKIGADAGDIGDVYALGGVVLLNIKEFEKAVSYFSESIARDSSDWKSYYGRGHAYVNLEKFKMAYADLKKSCDGGVGCDLFNQLKNSGFVN